MQYFYINKGSLNPKLRIALVQDGLTDYMKSMKINNLVQDSNITFSMRNVKDDRIKVKNGPVDIMLSDESGCEQRYILQYSWKPRDVDTKGTFRGQFTIEPLGDLIQDGCCYPNGTLIEPIVEDLMIQVK